LSYKKRSHSSSLFFFCLLLSFRLTAYGRLNTDSRTEAQDQSNKHFIIIIIAAVAIIIIINHQSSSDSWLDGWTPPFVFTISLSVCYIVFIFYLLLCFLLTKSPSKCYVLHSYKMMKPVRLTVNEFCLG